MRVRTSFVALALTAAGLAAAATPATATPHGDGDFGPTAIAFNNGSGSATANAITTGPITTVNSSTPPATGTPGTSMLTVTGATLNAGTVSIDVTYSCPSSLPSDTQLVTVVNQQFAGFASTQSAATCDGMSHVAEVDVVSGNSTPFTTGAVIVTSLLDSPTDQNGPFAQDQLFTTL